MFKAFLMMLFLCLIILLSCCNGDSEYIPGERSDGDTDDETSEDPAEIEDGDGETFEEDRDSDSIDIEIEEDLIEGESEKDRESIEFDEHDDEVDPSDGDFDNIDLDDFDSIEEADDADSIDDTEDADYSDLDGEIDELDEIFEEEEQPIQPDGLTWIEIPSGSFVMGCIEGDSDCESKEIPGHLVSVEQFEITSTEITQAQYRSVMGLTPSHFSDCGDSCPVEMVTWNDAVAFCVAVGGRLPSEAEWEYAARGGTQTVFPCGNDSACLDGIAWYAANSEETPHPVGMKDPNGFGLYDVIGNVSEWVADCWHQDYTDAPSHGGIWPGGNCIGHPVRGGEWDLHSPENLRSSVRFGADTTGYGNEIGFRCARGGPVYPDGDEEEEEELEIDEIEDEIIDFEIETWEQDFENDDAQTTLTWISLPPGSFYMGCHTDDLECRDEEKPRHLVSLPSFSILQTEVTQAQYLAVMGENPSHFLSCGEDCPVEQVAWWEAEIFCSEIGGRLPSESEWEYAARSGEDLIYGCSDAPDCLHDIAWFGEGADQQTHPVAQLLPTSWGLYDMFGNVQEWTQDDWHDDFVGAPDNGDAWLDDEINMSKVNRGAFWWDMDHGYLRVSDRHATYIPSKMNHIGFRCVKD